MVGGWEGIVGGFECVRVGQEGVDGLPNMARGRGWPGRPPITPKRASALMSLPTLVRRSHPHQHGHHLCMDCIHVAPPRSPPKTPKTPKTPPPNDLRPSPLALPCQLSCQSVPPYHLVSVAHPERGRQHPPRRPVYRYCGHQLAKFDDGGRQHLHQSIRPCISPSVTRQSIGHASVHQPYISQSDIRLSQTSKNQSDHQKPIKPPAHQTIEQPIKPSERPSNDIEQPIKPSPTQTIK